MLSSQHRKSSSLDMRVSTVFRSNTSSSTPRYYSANLVSTMIGLLLFCYFLIQEQQQHGNSAWTSRTKPNSIIIVTEPTTMSSHPRIATTTVGSSSQQPHAVRRKSLWRSSLLPTTLAAAVIGQESEPQQGILVDEPTSSSSSLPTSPRSKTLKLITSSVPWLLVLEISWVLLLGNCGPRLVGRFVARRRVFPRLGRWLQVALSNYKRTSVRLVRRLKRLYQNRHQWSTLSDIMWYVGNHNNNNKKDTEG